MASLGSEKDLCTEATNFNHATYDSFLMYVWNSLMFYEEIANLLNNVIYIFAVLIMSNCTSIAIDTIDSKGISSAVVFMGAVEELESYTA